MHVLNRLGFGPRPGDVDRVLAIGVSRYIEQQLHPEMIPDTAVAQRLKGLPTIAMSNAQLFDTFERPLREALRARKAAGAAAGADAGQADEETLRAMIPPETRPRRIVEELSAARVIRAADSERQLNEVMADFWMNHFNVFAAKGLDRVLLPSFEHDVVRPRMWGTFEDLLMATAKSPAMLFYLDNARSVADEEHRAPAPERRRALLERARARDPQMARQTKGKARGGINENYARELMELHTLGVDGGYTQKDVTELARALTGWSISGGPGKRRGEAEAEFVFRARMHDAGAKTILGHTFPAGGGIEEGEAMIRILAHHPATARHIAFQLCQRLMADDPPEALVERVAKVFLESGGNLRETVRAVVTSPEFSDPRFFSAKVKSPLEYVVSAVRALGGVTDGKALARQLVAMGEPLYLCQPPTGYSDRADAWSSSGSLIARLNFAVALGSGTDARHGRRAAPTRSPNRTPGAPKRPSMRCPWPCWEEAFPGPRARRFASTRPTTHPPPCPCPKSPGSFWGARNSNASSRTGPGVQSPESKEVMTMFDRRMFLKSSGLAIVAGGFLPGVFVRMARAGTLEGRRVLVAVFQRGAVDGLNVLVPYAEKAYYDARPSIAVPRPGSGENAALDLDGFFGLHPSIAPLLPYFRDRSAAFVHAVGEPRHDALALRRPGLHGVRHTGSQVHAGRVSLRALEEKKDPKARSLRAVAVTPRPAAHPRRVCRSDLHAERRAVRHPRGSRLSTRRRVL